MVCNKIDITVKTKIEVFIDQLVRQNWPVTYDHSNSIGIRVTEEFVHLLHRVSSNARVIDTQNLIAKTQSDHCCGRILAHEAHKDSVIYRMNSDADFPITVLTKYQLQNICQKFVYLFKNWNTRMYNLISLKRIWLIRKKCNTKMCLETEFYLSDAICHVSFL